MDFKKVVDPIQPGAEVILSLFESKHKIVNVSPDGQLVRIEPSVIPGCTTFVEKRFLRPVWMTTSNN